MGLIDRLKQLLTATWIPEEEDLAIDLARLEAEDPDWDRPSRLAMARYLLDKGRSRPLVVATYGEELVREAEGSRPKRRRPAKRVAAFEIKVEEIDFSFTRWADEIQPVIVGAKDFPFVSAETDYQQEPKAFSLERAFLPTKTELRRLLAVSEVVPGPLNVWAVDVPLLAS